MSASDIIMAVTALLGGLGGGIKWMLHRFDEKIDAMEARLDVLERRERIYLRRIYAVEAAARAAGVPIPETPGWPIEEDEA